MSASRGIGLPRWLKRALCYLRGARTTTTTGPIRAWGLNPQQCSEALGSTCLDLALSKSDALTRTYFGDPGHPPSDSQPDWPRIGEDVRPLPKRTKLRDGPEPIPRDITKAHVSNYERPCEATLPRCDMKFGRRDIEFRPPLLPRL